MIRISAPGTTALSEIALMAWTVIDGRAIETDGEATETDVKEVLERLLAVGIHDLRRRLALDDFIQRCPSIIMKFLRKDGEQ